MMQRQREMFFMVFIFCFFVVGRARNRIIGGYPSPPSAIPHMVHLDEQSFFFCGASLIDENWVLSAAHCYKQFDITVVLGDYDLTKNEGTEQTITPSMVIPHPQYNSYTKENDIMIIKLSTPAILNEYVQPIALPGRFVEPIPGERCTVCGWGNQQIAGNEYPDILRCVELPIIATSICNDVTSYNGLIKETMFCIGNANGGVDACDGDSGGPASCGGQLLGIVSWGYGCGYTNFPGVYVKVSRYIDWISNTIKYN